jgi:hypothetical protein
MSQLSFADVFNLARETADNSPVIQAGQQIAETVPTVHRMMRSSTAGAVLSAYLRIRAAIWGAGKCSVIFCPCRQRAGYGPDTNAGSIEHCRKICARYEATDIAKMQEMFCLMVCALEAKFHDFLGAIFMELELGDNFRGQYFTPYPAVSDGADADARRQRHYPPGRDCHRQRSGLWCRRDADRLCRVPA